MALTFRRVTGVFVRIRDQGVNCSQFDEIIVHFFTYNKELWTDLKAE